MSEPKPLDPALRRLLDLDREADLASVEAKARVLGRVLGTVGAVSIGLGPPAPGGGSDPGAGFAAARTAWTNARPWSLALAVGAGGIAGAVASSAWHGARPEHVVYIDRTPLPAAAPVASEAPSSEASHPRESARASATGSASPVVDLAAERKLLDVARRSLGSGDTEGALASLRRHEQNYRSGQLAEEREALTIEALVLARRVDEARAREHRFRQRYPESVMLPAVEAAVSEGSGRGP
jgi:hypothetical protein